MSTVEKEPRTIVAPFTVEADHPRNADLMLQNIPGCRLRGAVKASRTVKTMRRGKEVELIPKDQSRHLGVLPEIPGMQISVNPAKCSYRVIDPLHDDEELCEQITLGLVEDERLHDPESQKIHGVKPQRGTIDPHRMKTLCRELFDLSEENHVKIIKGVIPTMDRIDKLPGKYLLNPGARVRNGQPRYEEDMPAWVANLDSRGG